LRQSLAADETVHFLGEDVLDPYGGAFKVAEGLSTQFPDRVHTTPVSEAGIVGLGVGMALRGLKPVVEIMFGDFVTLAADQLINHAAKFRWMSNDQVRVPLVVRTPMGGRRGYGPTHSQTLDRLYLGVPGLRVVAPHSLLDPGAMLADAILLEQDPLLFLEHKLLYSQTVRRLDDLPEFVNDRSAGRYPVNRFSLRGAPPASWTFTTYGYMTGLVLEAIERLAYQHEIFGEAIVYTQLSPFDPTPLAASLARTGRLLTVEEGSRTHGWGAEAAAAAASACLQPPLIRRVAAKDMPVPAAGPLEDEVLPGVDDVVQAVLAERAKGSGR
jgi:pyruvate/2-oxoglutarate/acetoin dehydrogenase E1 component